MHTLPPISRAHLQVVIGQVARSALEASGAGGVALLDDGSPEAGLAAALLAESLPAGRLERVTADDPDLEPVLRYAGANTRGGDAHAVLEAIRFRARLRQDRLTASSANKTALLLAPPPPEPLLPLGDLYATQVAEVAGGWSAPPEVEALADLAGGMEALDTALFRRFDLRLPSGLDGLPDRARRGVEAALDRLGHHRRYPVVVPKIGPRTVGVDLHE